MTLQPLEPVREAGQTFLKHFERCRRSAYLYRTVEARSIEMDRGTLFHAAWQKAILTMIEQDEPTIPPDLAKALLEETFTERTDLTVPWSEKDALRYMVAHSAEAWDLAPERIVGVEVPLSLQLGEYTVRGRVDLIVRSHAEQTLEIPDWKTSFAFPDQAEYEGDFQGWFYALLVLFGTDESGECLGDGAQWVIPSQRFPRFLKEDGTLVERSMLRSRLEITEFREHVIELLGKLDREWQAQEWPPMPGDHCSECPASALCPIPAEWRRHAGTINTHEQAAEAAEWVDRTAAEVAATNKELKAWSKHNGPVRFGRDLVLDHVLQESRAVKKAGQRSDWDGLQTAIRAAVEYGEPFEIGEWVLPRTSNQFKKRVLTADELAAERQAA